MPMISPLAPSLIRPSIATTPLPVSCESDTLLPPSATAVGIQVTYPIAFSAAFDGTNCTIASSRISVFFPIWSFSTTVNRCFGSFAAALTKDCRVYSAIAARSLFTFAGSTLARFAFSQKLCAIV